MNKFSNILKLPRSTYHSQELLKRIERKINDNNKIEEKSVEEIKRDDIVYNYIEFPENIIIEPDYDRLDNEKYFGVLLIDDNLFIKYENLRQVENKQNDENLNKADMEIDIAKEEKKEQEIIIDNVLNEEKIAIEPNTVFNNDNEKFKSLEIFKSKRICEIKEFDKYLFLTLNVLDYYPKNIQDFSLIFCPECKERYISIVYSFSYYLI